MKNKVENLLLQPRLRICITRLCVGNSDSDEQIKCDTDIVTIFTRNTIPRTARFNEIHFSIVCIEIQMSITFILKTINIFSFYDSTNFISEKRGGSNLLL